MDIDWQKLPEFLPGWVWLVGAGPGDPGLITLHGLNGLRQADVIIYDALVNQDILNFAGKDTICEYAGKRGGKPSMQQSDISLHLVDLARAGKKVLRLKGGDPFVFARGGEEAETLIDHDIPFRIVPGISAGIGGLAYAGIPVTHRDVNQSVIFLSGHDRHGNTPAAIDWNGVAQGANVIIMYMALKHIEEISTKLLNAGRDKHEPVAIITNATLPDMQIYETNLQQVAKLVKDKGIQPPAIICVGNNVLYRHQFNWLKYLAA